MQGGEGSIPGQGTKTPYALRCGQKNKQLKKKNRAQMGIASLRGSKFCVCVYFFFKVKCQIVPIRYYHLCKKVEDIKNFFVYQFLQKEVM